MRMLLSSLLIFFLGGMISVRADTSAALHSSALGEGWFEYRIHFQYNAFFDVVDFIGLGFGFQDFQEFGQTDDADELQVNGPDVTVIWRGVQPRNLDRVVTVRSQSLGIIYTNFFIAFIATPSGWGKLSPMLSGNIAGYVRIKGLTAGGLDGTTLLNATTHSNAVIIPDPQIVNLTDNSITWKWTEGATMQIEASRDLQTWNQIVEVINTSSVHTWVSPYQLETYGDHFRVNLVSNILHIYYGPMQRTSLHSSSVPSILPTAFLDEGLGFVGIQFPSQKGQIYSVTVWDISGQLINQTTLLASNTLSKIVIADQGSPGLRLVKIVPVVP